MFKINTITQVFRYILTDEDYKFVVGLTEYLYYLRDRFGNSMIAESWETANRSLDLAAHYDLDIEQQHQCWILGMIRPLFGAEIPNEDRTNPLSSIENLVKNTGFGDLIQKTPGLARLTEKMKFNTGETREARRAKIANSNVMELLIVEYASAIYNSSINRLKLAEHHGYMEPDMEEITECIDYARDAEVFADAMEAAHNRQNSSYDIPDNNAWKSVKTDATPM